MNESQSTSDERVHWVGIDVAKKTFDAALVRDGQKYPATPIASIPVRSFSRTPQGVCELVEWLDSLVSGEHPSCAMRAVMEATGRYSTELAVWMAECRPALAPAIQPPHHTAAFIKSMGLRSKTDKLEARALGFYGMERQPVAYKPADKKEALLRDLARHRDFLVRQRVNEANRAEEVNHCTFARKMADRRLAQTDRDIEKTEAQMHKVVDSTPELKGDIDQLCTIYGVGFIIAATVRAELGDLRRFEKARQLSAYAGLTPAIRESGTSVKGRPHLDKNGNPHVRQALYLAAMVIIRGKNNLQRDYLRLRENGQAPKSALGAIMRKLLVLMRAILISGKPFDPMWKTLPKCVHVS